jgi:hypothetical protein
MKVFPSIFVLAIILSIFSTSTFGNAITFVPGRSDSQRLRWKGQAVKISISSSLTRPSSNIKSDSDVLGALRRSIQAWSDAADIDIQTELSDKQSVSPAGVAGDGISLITIAQSPENVLFFANDADSVSAKTRIFYNRRGFITEADIVLNPFQQFSTDGTYGTFDLESTLTHEIGHLLGLKHSAVLGATMAESFARNGTRGIVDFGPRTLSESDIAAIRDIYGPKPGDETCCAAINGKIISGPAHPASGLKVWAEDSETGRVLAITDTAADGTYHIGGLLAGSYSLYWKGQDAAQNSMGKVGDLQLETLENKTLNAKVSLKAGDLSVQYLGLNGRLADFSLPITGGRSYTLNVGGHDLDAGISKIEFSSPHITAMALPPVIQQFSENISGLTYFVSVDPDIPAGQYTLTLIGDNGSKTCLIGGLNVE